MTLPMWSVKIEPNTKNTETDGSNKYYTELKCSECDKTFSSKGSLDRHFQHHTGQYSYFCSQCNKGFNNSYNFKEHMKGHEGTGYLCDYCGKVFKSKKGHGYHQSEHTGVYRFTCEYCNEKFNDHPKYVKHLEGHK